MQPINAISSSQGSGIDPWRDVQAALRNIQKLRGQTPATTTESLTARPVPGAQGAQRGTILSNGTRAAPTGPTTDRDEPTGPRPTFRRTPLEQMRSEILDPAPAAMPPAASDSAESRPAGQPEPAPVNSAAATSVGSLYDDSRRADSSAETAFRINIVT